MSISTGTSFRAALTLALAGLMREPKRVPLALLGEIREGDSLKPGLASGFMFLKSEAFKLMPSPRPLVFDRPGTRGAGFLPPL